MINSKLSKKNILVVDDDPVILKILQTRLQEKGYAVTVKDMAAEGLEYVFKNKPDLIILDVMMPIINGFNFCKLLKSEIKESRIPIIFLTSRIDEEDVRIGYEMGADAYLTKPLDIKVLLLKIEELLK